MRILVYSDMHFFDEPALFSGVPSRSVFQAQTCDWIAARIRDLQPQIVVNLGDTNHRQGLIDMPTLTQMVRGLSEIQRAASDAGAIHVHVAGNHDRYDALGEDSVVAAFPDYVGLVGAPPVLKVVRDETYIDWSKCGFIPYISDVDPISFGARVEGLLAAGVRILFVHQGIGGALWSTGMTDEHGVDPKLLQQFSLVVGGHYHHPQTIGSNIVIAGSPFYFNFSDSWIPEHPRGLLLIDADFDRSGDVQVSRIENPVTPIRHTLSVERVGDVAQFLADAESFGVLPRMILRVKCARSEVAVRIKQQFENCGLLKLVVQDVSDGPRQGATPILESVESDRPDETVRRHVERATTTLDRNQLTDVGLRLVVGD